jgi:hypothetical protein
MCPFCLASVAFIAGSVTGTGGLTAIVAGAIFKRKRGKKFPEHNETQEDNRGNHSDGSKEPEGGLAR